MRLTELDPWFLRITGPNEFEIIHDIGRAQGVEFLCPVCFVKNGGKTGTHRVICWSRSRGVPDDLNPKPGRWTLEGTGYNDLTLNGDPPSSARSVRLSSPCGWHGFVTNGEVT